MKKLILALVVVPFLAMASAQAATVTVKLDGLRNLEGNVHLYLSNSKESYDSEDNYLLAPMMNAKGGGMFVMADLPTGEYAFIIHHDENGNGKMDEGFMGIPEEGFAFSNNIRPSMSKPSFESVKFSVKEADVATTIRMIYM